MDDLQKPTILICDDEEDIQEICTNILHTDYDLICADNYLEILQKVVAYAPDLILLDLWLWGQRGEDVVIELRKNNITQSIPIILFSAKEHLDQISTELQVNGFLHKPFTVKELRAKIEQVLSGSHA